MRVSLRRVLGALALVAAVAAGADASHGQSLLWAKQMGGGGADQPSDLALDPNGNVYLTALLRNAARNNDVLVSKRNRAGRRVWDARMGGSGNDNPSGIAVDSEGNVYTTGGFEGTADFDPGPGSAFLASSGGQDIFLSKLDSEGRFVWALSVGSFIFDEGVGVAVDESGEVIVVGHYQGTVDFDPGAATFSLSSQGRDVFALKVDTDGHFVWARSVGGSLTDEARSFAVDAEGSLYVTGNFQDVADFDPGPAVVNLTAAGNRDAFILKLDTSGQFVWARGVGSGTFASDEVPFGLAVDPGGNVFTTGRFSDTVDFDPGPGEFPLSATSGTRDVFVLKLNTAGNFVWAVRLGGPQVDVGFGIAVDGRGSVYTIGEFGGTVDFDPGAGAFELTAASAPDIFVSKLYRNGDFGWALHFDAGAGLEANSLGASVEIGNRRSVHLAGPFTGTTDFNPGPGVTNLTANGGANHLDIFVAKLAQP
jgi:hypothetical protein